MTTNECIAILTTHNEWRRGSDIEPTNPKLLGEALDHAIEHMSECMEFDALMSANSINKQEGVKL